MINSLKSKPAKDVDEYLSALPESVRATLERVRKTIKSAVPSAVEVISYQVPLYKYNGQPFAAFAAFKNHCSYYVMSHSAMKIFKNEISSYDTSGVTIHFPFDKPLPPVLVKKLIMAKIKENKNRTLKKSMKK